MTEVAQKARADRREAVRYALHTAERSETPQKRQQPRCYTESREGGTQGDAMNLHRAGRHAAFVFVAEAENEARQKEREKV